MYPVLSLTRILNILDKISMSVTLGVYFFSINKENGQASRGNIDIPKVGTPRNLHPMQLNSNKSMTCYYLSELRAQNSSDQHLRWMFEIISKYIDQT